jgi:hypothetical protein
MSGQTVILSNSFKRKQAHKLIDCAPYGHVISIKPPTRSGAQNDKMWALLSDIARAKPEGRRHTAEIWKCLFMAACGHAVQFEQGLDGAPFPIGFRTSRLTKEQMSDLIEFIHAYAAKHGVKLED